NVAFAPEALPSTALSTAPVKAGPSRIADIFYLDESTLVGENVLDSDSSSEEEDQRKKDSNGSEDESDSSSSEESSSREEENDKGKDKEVQGGPWSAPGTQKVAVQVVLVVKRKRMIAVKEKMSIIRMMKVIKK